MNRLNEAQPRNPRGLDDGDDDDDDDDDDEDDDDDDEGRSGDGFDDGGGGMGGGGGDAVWDNGWQERADEMTVDAGMPRFARRAGGVPGGMSNAELNALLGARAGGGLHIPIDANLLAGASGGLNGQVSHAVIITDMGGTFMSL